MLMEDAFAKRGRLNAIMLLVSVGVRFRCEALELKGLRSRVPDEATRAIVLRVESAEYMKVRLPWQ